MLSLYIRFPGLIEWRLISSKDYVVEADLMGTLKPVYSCNSLIVPNCVETAFTIRPPSLTCSEMCLHIRGSVCMKSEHVFLFSSLGLVARLLLWWLLLPSLNSRLYLLWGAWGSITRGTGAWDSVAPWDGSGGGVGSSSAEFWMWSIHCTISSLIPQPPTWPTDEWK
jgi:hypothetical protein